VVRAARESLDANDVGLVLPYVPEYAEAELKEAFEVVTVVRGQGRHARDLADRYFFETVVRLHRAGEGAPYTGLKPMGLDVGPVIPAAEHALATGVPEGLLAVLRGELDHQVARRFHRVQQLKASAHMGVQEAREYVSEMLGLQVWAHKIHQAIKASAHEEAHVHAEAA
jgi:hypothetical protein